MSSSERGFGVRLTASVDQYMAAMAKATAATATFSETSQANVKKLGGQMTHVGGMMTAGITLPLVGAAAGAVKLSADFDTAFGRMVGLAGVTAGQVDGLKSSVLDLAGATGQAPVDLANALYFASSAGLDTANAMDAVSIAAKASAAGMGSAEDVVGLIASATANYGEANITAAQAVDVLTAAVKDGRADPTELAGSMGKLLTIAAPLGISFSDVGGAVAFLSNSFGNTSQTVDAFNGVLQKLFAPGQQAQQALKDAGTSVTALKSAITDNGLMGALDLLRDHGFADNAIAARQFFEDSNAVAAGMSLMQDTSHSLQKDLDDTKNSTGALDDAFAAMSDSGGFKMKAAWAEIQVALVKAGEIIVPIVSGIAGAAGDLAEKFAGLPKPVQAIIVGFLGLAAAAGPVIVAVGTVLKNFTLIQAAVSKLSTVGADGEKALTGVGMAASGVGIALGVAGAAFAVYEAVQSSAAAAGERAAKVTEDTVSALNDEVKAIVDLQHATGTIPTDVQSASDAAEAFNASLLGAGDSGKKLTAAMGALGLGGQDVGAILRSVQADTGGFISTQLQARGATKELADAVGDFMGSDAGDNWGQALEQLSLGFSINKGDLYDLTQQMGLSKTEATALLQALGAIGDAGDDTHLDKIASNFLVDAAGKGAEALVAQAEAMAGTTRNADDAYLVYEKYVGLLETSAKGTLPKWIKGTDDGSTAIDGLGDAADKTAKKVFPLIDAQDRQGEAARGGADQNQAWADAQERGKNAVERLKASISGQVTVFDALSSAASELKAALDAVFGGSMSMEEANRAAQAAQDDLTQSFKDNGKTIDITTEKGRANRDQIEQSVKSILDYGTAVVGAGGSTEQAAASIDYMTAGLKSQLHQAGLTDDQINDYLTTLGLTPENVTTAIQLAHDTEAKTTLDGLLTQLGVIDTGAEARVQALIDKGEYDQAITLARTLLAYPSHVATTIDITTNMHGAGEGARNGSAPAGPTQAEIDAWIAANTPHSAAGRYVSGPMVSTLGEGGRPEVVLPLTNQGRMRTLLGDGRVSGPIMAALGGVQSADGNIVNISHTVIPAAPASVSVGSATSAANDDDVMARKFKRGVISAQEYDAYLATQQANEEQFSAREDQLWEKRQDLARQAIAEAQHSADTKQALDDAATAREDARMQWLYDHQQISAADYQAYLGGKLANEEVFSQGWLAIESKMEQVRDAETAKVKQADDDRLKSQQDRLSGMFDQWRLEQRLSDAIRDQAASYDALQTAAVKAYLTSQNGDATDADRAAANTDLETARARAAADVISGADARANELGFKDDTPEWARFMRSQIADFIPGHPDVAAALTQYLAMLPSFAAGGYVPATPGGAIVRVAERGVGEYMVPADKMLVSASAGGGGWVDNRTFVTKVEISGTVLDRPGLAREMREILAEDDRRNGRSLARS